MDDIKRQMQKRFEQQANSAGWRAHLPPIAETETPVPVWLYSVNPKKGPRLFGQLSLNAYREGVLSSAALQQPVERAPWDVLNSALALYDAANGPADDLELRAQLFAALITYARCTRSWEIKPDLNKIPGLHFVVVDWQDKKGTYILRPVMAVGAGVLPMEELSVMVMAALDLHLAKHPEEAPVL
jgi:hypothetical protein